MKASTSKYLFAVGGVVLIFLIYLIVSLTTNNQVLFPSIPDLTTSFIGLFNVDGLISIGFTVLRLLGTIAISVAISLLFAFLYFLYKPLIYLFKPILLVMKVAPIIAIILYVQVLTASMGEGQIYIIAPMFVIPIMTEAYISAIDNLDKVLMDVTKLETDNKAEVFFRLIIPMILPNISLSLLQSVGLGIKVIIMVEFFCFTDYGLGHMLHNFYTNVNMASLLALIFFVVIIVVAIEISINIAKKKLLKE